MYGSPDLPNLTTRALEWRARIAALLVFAATCAYRFIGLDLTNDDLLFFAIGRQIAVFGEWPVRDLFEEGDPLHNVISAVLQTVTGHSLAGEVLFDIGVLALAAAVTTLVAARMLRSALAGAFVATLTVLAWPRLYDYPKTLIPACSVLLCARYLEQPSRLRAIGLGLFCGCVFLLRHDLGAYAAASVLVAIAATSWRWRVWPTGDLAAWILATALIVLPYLAFVQVHVGVIAYLTSARQFTEREVSRSDDAAPRFAADWSQPFWRADGGRAVKIRWAAATTPDERAAAEQRYSLTRGRIDEGRTWAYVVGDTSASNLAAIVRDPEVEDTANIDRVAARGPGSPAPSRLRRIIDADVAIAPGILTRHNAVAWLYFTYRALPWLTLAGVGIVLLRHRAFDPGVQTLLPALAFCLVSAPLLLRGNLFDNSRLADFTTPAALLAAAVIPVVWQKPSPALRMAIRTLAVAGIVITTLAIASFGAVGPRLKALGVLIDEGGGRDEAERLWQGIVATPPRLDWVARASGVRGAVEYLQQCTSPADRVLIYGFFPEVLFYSGRGSAADRIVLQRGFGVSAEDERRTLQALTRHPAAAVIVEATPGSGTTADRVLDGLHPLVEQYLATHYTRVAMTGFGGSTGAAFDVWMDNARSTTQAGPYGVPCP